MIDSLKGILSYKEPGLIVVDVSGVGYQVHIANNEELQKQALGSELIIHTHLIHKENIMELYGFWTRIEREVFRFLIEVNGVGARLGLKIFSVLDYTQIINAIRTHNTRILSQVSGLGAKKAERIIIDLQETFQKRYTDIQKTHTLNHNALEALLTLGYKTLEAQNALQQVLEAEHPQTTEEIIRASLKILKAAHT